jgi:hypothetical protein
MMVLTKRISSSFVDCDMLVKHLAMVLDISNMDSNMRSIWIMIMEWTSRTYYFFFIS